MITFILHWLWVHTGIQGSGPWYGFWSGFGSDIGEVTIFGGILGMYYKHNCHQARCFRVGKHTVDGTPWCNKHHQKAREDVMRRIA